MSDYLRKPYWCLLLIVLLFTVTPRKTFAANSLGVCLHRALNTLLGRARKEVVQPPPEIKEIMSPVYTYQRNITMNDYYDKNYEVVDKLRRSLQQNAPPEHQEEFLKHEENLAYSLQHIFYNTVQHGDLNTGRRVAESSQNQGVNVGVKTETLENGVRVSVSNPQMKDFPANLQKRFYAGDSVSIPTEQRVGFRGAGWAHKMIIGILEDLPTGSYVEWIADGDTVTAIVHIQLKQ